MPYLCPETGEVGQVFSRIYVLIAVPFSLIERSNDQRPDLFDIGAIFFQQLLFRKLFYCLISLRVLFFEFLLGLVDEERPQLIGKIIVKRLLLLQFLDSVQ